MSKRFLCRIGIHCFHFTGKMLGTSEEHGTFVPPELVQEWKDRHVCCRCGIIWDTLAYIQSDDWL